MPLIFNPIRQTHDGRQYFILPGQDRDGMVTGYALETEEEKQKAKTIAAVQKFIPIEFVGISILLVVLSLMFFDVSDPEDQSLVIAMCCASFIILVSAIFFAKGGLSRAFVKPFTSKPSEKLSLQQFK